MLRADDPAQLTAAGLQALRCPPEGAHEMLDYLKGRGGIRAFLRQIGLSEQHIAQLRARLRH